MGTWIGGWGSRFSTPTSVALEGRAGIPALVSDLSAKQRASVEAGEGFAGGAGKSVGASSLLLSSAELLALLLNCDF